MARETILFRARFVCFSEMKCIVFQNEGLFSTVLLAFVCTRSLDYAEIQKYALAGRSVFAEFVKWKGDKCCLFDKGSACGELVSSGGLPVSA